MSHFTKNEAMEKAEPTNPDSQPAFAAQEILARRSSWISRLPGDLPPGVGAGGALELVCDPPSPSSAIPLCSSNRMKEAH